MSNSKDVFYDKFIKKNNSHPTKNKSSKNNKNDNEKAKHKNNQYKSNQNLKNQNVKNHKKDFIKANKILNSELVLEQKNVFADFSKTLNKDSKNLLSSFDKIAKKALGLSSKEEDQLPKEIRKLFHELTDDRGSRKVNYLNNPIKLSAYIYYYMWWNLVRAFKLVSNLGLDLNDDAVIADFGCGPFTMLCAFWIARPELREKKLHWYCVDISSKALSAGENIFKSLCEYSGLKQDDLTWKVTKVVGKFGTKLNKPVDLFISANMFNEIFWDSRLKIYSEANKAVGSISKYLKKGGSSLVIEPGIPQGGEFIYYLRKAFLQKNFFVKSPCPNSQNCSIPASSDKNLLSKNFPTANNKWCHFSFFTDDAPKKLIDLSDSANLKKVRASLSFLYCKEFNKSENGNSQKQLQKNSKKEKSQEDKKIFLARISSDLLKLPDGKIGRYACSEKGFLLIVERYSPKAKLKQYIEGALIKLETKNINLFLKDKKTGALLFEI